MRRLLAVAAIAAAALVPAGAVHADSYCARSGLTIFGEPWLAHQVCVPCPIPGGSCPWIDPPIAMSGADATPAQISIGH